MYEKIKKALLYGLIASSVFLGGCDKQMDVKVEKPYQEKKVEKEDSKLEEKVQPYQEKKIEVKEDIKKPYQENKLEKLINNEKDETLKTFYEVLKEMKDENDKEFSKYEFPLKTSTAYDKDFNEVIKSLNETYALKVENDKTIDSIVNSPTKKDDKELGTFLARKSMYERSLLPNLEMYSNLLELQEITTNAKNIIENY